MPQRIECPVCGRDIALSAINRHLDEGCPEEPADAPKVQFAGIFSQQTSKSKLSDPAAEEIPRGPLYPGFLPPAAKSRAGASISNTIADSSEDRGTSSAGADQAPSSKSSPLAAPSTSQQVQGHQKRTLPLPFQGSSPGSQNDTPSAASRTLNSDAATADPDSPAAKRQKTISSGSLAAATRHSAMPLAERVRPNKLDNIYGQDLVGPSGILRRMIETDSVKSMILWGGPGCGKTTIARTIAASTKARFVELSGTTNNVADCKKIFDQAKSEMGLLGRKTILFIDEIHRFSKTQQDVFLAPAESGQVILIGATTENPSFKIQSALLSRCRVFSLKPLSTESTLKILNRALSTEFPDSSTIPPLLDSKLLTYLAEFASGDARTALNLLEISIQLASQKDGTDILTQEDLKKALTRTLVYDRQGDGHYDTISAFHKSVRGNDGEDPLFISRRMMVMASEDIGLADNSLLSLATATHFAVQNVGMPEARINLAHCTVALCLAKKSTRTYRGISSVLALLQSDPEAASAPIPLHLRNAPTTLMKNLGYGKAYKYPPNYVDGIVKQEYLPASLVGRKFLDDRDLGELIDEDDDAYAALAENDIS
ncbi:hypothetical protein Dda_4523 [Drechslerella dactyloides]|uniref:UBZ4-type domain-containing protein n=1 Tax=Drechslerella dactyloides TaxID=74499 RepID=A0AAD6IX33_DREDA|nr:hypothetical protein Dda_4523 [Drechslerella dactyloides]